MTNLSRVQKDFLNNEFGLSYEQIEEIGKDEWHDIREKCYDIILDEMLIDFGKLTYLNKQNFVFRNQ